MFERLISKLARHLDRLRIPYMIIGGQAVLLYGTPRLTKDIDITLGISIERASDIVGICKSAKLNILPENYTDFISKTFVLPVEDKTSGIRVDFIFSFTPYEKQAIERSNKVRIGNISVKFASVEDVIIHKIFAGRARDMEDVKNMVLKNRKLNKRYIKKWLGAFDHASDDTKLTELFERTLNEIKKLR
jgi:predicted nucleotidyltransferase